MFVLNFARLWRLFSFPLNVFFSFLCFTVLLPPRVCGRVVLGRRRRRCPGGGWRRRRPRLWREIGTRTRAHFTTAQQMSALFAPLSLSLSLSCTSLACTRCSSSFSTVGTRYNGKVWISFLKSVRVNHSVIINFVLVLRKMPQNPL